MGPLEEEDPRMAQYSCLYSHHGSEAEGHGLRTGSNVVLSLLLLTFLSEKVSVG